MVSLLPRRMLLAPCAAIGALVLAGSIGLSPAYAEPTPTPTPAASPAPTLSPSAEVTPTATSEPTPEPAATSAPEPEPTPTAGPTFTPTPEPTPSKTSASSAVAAAKTPTRWQRLSGLRAGLRDEGAAAMPQAHPSDTADERFSFAVFATCPQPTEPAEVEVEVVSNVAADLTLQYAVTRSQRTFGQGSITIPAGGTVSAVVGTGIEDAGNYHLGFYEGDPSSGNQVASQIVQVVDCLSAPTECGKITFRSANPFDVPVVYGEGPAADADLADSENFILGPSGVQAVRVDYETLYWFAGIDTEGAGENFVVSLAGEDPNVEIPQDCEPPPLSQTLVNCAAPGKAARLQIELELGPTDRFRAEILNSRGEVVVYREGSAAAEPVAHRSYRLSLPGLGRYRFNYYRNDLSTPFETLAFQVQGCLDVKASTGRDDGLADTGVPSRTLPGLLAGLAAVVAGSVLLCRRRHPAL